MHDNGVDRGEMAVLAVGGCSRGSAVVWFGVMSCPRFNSMKRVWVTKPLSLVMSSASRKNQTILSKAGMVYYRGEVRGRHWWERMQPRGLVVYQAPTYWLVVMVNQRSAGPKSPHHLTR